MKIYQLISQGCALVLLTALPSFAETKNKVILVPGENLFPLKCETIQGSIDANDKVAPQGTLHNSASRYDSYSVKTDPGNIVFFELTTPNSDYSNFMPQLTTQMVDKKTGAILLSASAVLPKSILEAWYFSRKATETTNRNLYISSATSGGNYQLRIAYARPSSNLSESQIEAAIGINYLGSSFQAYITGSSSSSPHPVDMNALCKN
ncbi:hypothetical protein [Sphaerospermopsis torques-reginae]|uniref:Uncharacterized protein n=1 Tax=Sphaerospermopsis torques-reginae ITEP-024 TaxID=984208 RepID=A0ABX8X3Y3_9CYAN|nr:hypothetical protein [Sphaerospermopsis torques-reginae]QYX33386.1 hypothetical protein K2F26_08740 [Sphaerospermopsis torques-reginae ITEP-024]